jgi:hypothetical protein
MLNSNCYAQKLVAADYATNSAYADGWTNGQNAGYGFGPWSFYGTNPDPVTNSAGVPYPYQGIGAASPLGNAWTLLTHSNASGIAICGRAIPGGLQPGQTFETVLQNPTTYNYYRGFDFLLTSGTNNNPGGVNINALRLTVFQYHNSSQYWAVQDAEFNSRIPPFSAPLTGAAGMKLDFTLISTNTYSLTMTPLSDPSMAYTNSGTLTNLPITWVNFRNWNGNSSGLTDTANNFSISSMTISALTLNIEKDGTNVLLSWLGGFTNFNLVSSTDLNVPGWTAVTNLPSIVNGQNVVTNPITGKQQFFRLQLQQ